MSFYGIPLISRQSELRSIGKQKSNKESPELEVSKNLHKYSLDSNSKPPATLGKFRIKRSFRKGLLSRHSAFFKKVRVNFRRKRVPSAVPVFASHQSSQAQSAYKKSNKAPNIGHVIPPKLSPKVPENSATDQDILKQREKTEEYHQTQENHSESNRIAIPEFVLLTDLSVFNTEKGIKEAFLEPRLPLSRFERFMKDIERDDVRDPIAHVYSRDESLRKYLENRSVYMTSRWSETSSENPNDEQKIYDCISHELFKCRDIISTLLNQQLESISGYRNVACEMLVHGNTKNYVRYILALPECSPSQEQNLNESQKQAYEIKRALFGMGDALVTLDKFVKDDFPEKALIRDIILSKSISKQYLNFNRLEYYAIQIWMRYTGDFLIDKLVTSNLHRLHRLFMAIEKRESLKVLVFNQVSSSNYSWYLAVTLPFTRIFEASLVNENVSFNSEDTDSSSTVKSPSHLSETFSINDTDDSLYKTYYSKLKLDDFEKFSQLSVKELVNLQRSLSPKTGTRNIIIKPANFEYYGRPLSTLSSETFQVVQCRDFMIQVPPKNRKSVLKEFRRILKVGGVIELPLFFFGSRADVLSASFWVKGLDSSKVKNVKWKEPPASFCEKGSDSSKVKKVRWKEPPASFCEKGPESSKVKKVKWEEPLVSLEKGPDSSKVKNVEWEEPSASLEKCPDSSKVKSEKWEEPYIIDSLKEILAYLNDLFGHKNITFEKCEIIEKDSCGSYLTRHTAMFSQKSFTQLDQFEKLAQTATQLQKLGKDDVCFYIYMRAEKDD